MEGHLTLSEKERRRLAKFEEVQAGRMSLVQAARLLGLSYRQAKRSYARFRAEGDRGVVHRRRGCAGNRRKPASAKAAVLERYRAQFAGFGPTLAAEELGREGWGVDHETLRRWLLESGDWRPRRKRCEHRARRTRRARFGELVQMDGSHHAWLGEGDRRYCLMNLVDDATGTTLAVMGEEETAELAMRALWRWVERYGVPQALYTDRHSVYLEARAPTLEEELAGTGPLTAFGKACSKLGIERVFARSPQAKGRVERNHAVYQDRLVKLLGRNAITTLEGANRFLEAEFVHRVNAAFAKPAADPADAHRPLGADLDLGQVFCFEQVRTLMNDWCLRHDNAFYQIHRDNHPLPRPKDKVLVRTRLDGTRDLLYRDRPLTYTLLPGPLAKNDRAASASPPARPRKPAADHPWNRPFKTPETPPPEARELPTFPPPL